MSGPPIRRNFPKSPRPPKAGGRRGGRQGGTRAARGGAARPGVAATTLDMPRIVPVRASGIYRGDGWLGVKMRDASVVKGVGVLPMFAGLIGLLLLLGAFAATWVREGR